jgi:hypothetical protein
MCTSRLLKTIACLYLSGAACSAFAAGAYVSDRALVSINRANTWFRSDFPVVARNLPASARIRSVSWRYERPNLPAGATFSAQLCHPSPLSCQDISSSQAGSSEFFQGRSASAPLFIQYRVERNAGFPPLAPKPAQLIVNWSG